MTLCPPSALYTQVSDVDELLDPRLVPTASFARCRSPMLRHYHYGVHCPEYKPVFTRSLLFRASSGWLNYTYAQTPSYLVHPS